MRFHVNDILKITGGKLISPKNTSGNFSISTDTRTINPEEIYLPLIGENFDGHNFIEAALDKGCRGFITDNAHLKEIKAQIENAKFVIAVEDTLTAYLQIANFARKKINPIVIGVTGSSGKTTTKEMLYSVLSQQYITHKSKLNHNNEIGLCQTLLNMPDNTEFVIAEMGMRGLGEIELLSKYAEPDIAIITNVGNAHIGRLGSEKNIALAKCEIAKHLNCEGLLISHYTPLVTENCNWQGKKVFYDLPLVNITAKNTHYSQYIYKENEYELSVGGDHNILNSLAVIETARACGVSIKNIRKGLQEYQPIDNRGQIIELSDNIKVINDSYNANPESVKAAINAVTDSYKDSKIFLVLGNMAELGEYTDKLHRETGKFVDTKTVNTLITVGESAKLIADEIKSNNIAKQSFSNIEDGVEYLKKHLTANSVVLLKASRCMSFEKIAEQLKGMNE